MRHVALNRPSIKVTTNGWKGRRSRQIHALREHVSALEVALASARAILNQRDLALREVARIEARVRQISSEIRILFPRLTRARAQVCGLTTTEHRVYEFAKSHPGLIGKELAYGLNMAPRTYKFHMANILLKMGVGSRTEL